MEEAFEFYKKAKLIMHEGGFELRKWASNSKELMDLINGSEVCDINVDVKHNKKV